MYFYVQPVALDVFSCTACRVGGTQYTGYGTQYTVHLVFSLLKIHCVSGHLLFWCLVKFGCLAVWMFGCLDVWLFGGMIVWVFGWFVDCLFGCLVDWIIEFGKCLDVWLSGCFIVGCWLFGCLNVDVWMFWCFDVWLFGRRIQQL